ncbi:AMP-binding protein, partial [Streptomyces xiamenensis]|uniref:AMP-binding protein n=1 Tax=Streptomyces xiamenensis TaxID=408015 RepID=UPI0035E0B54B
ALHEAERALDYAALRARACSWAAGLQAQGGDVVGLALPRGEAQIAAMLAAWYAGQAWLALDPRLPDERLAYMVGDSGAGVVLGEGPRPSWLPAAVAWRTPETLAGDGLSDIARAPDAVAYLIYTSGSTGQPKGVRVSHRSVQALLGAVERDFALTCADVWSFFHSFAFDFSVWEVWGALITGARVHVVAHATSRDPQAFIAEANAQGVSVLSQTPSAFGQLMA